MCVQSKIKKRGRLVSSMYGTIFYLWDAEAQLERVDGAHIAATLQSVAQCQPHAVCLFALRATVHTPRRRLITDTAYRFDARLARRLRV